MISKSDVVNAYRYILGRDPESEAVVRRHSSLTSIEALRRSFLQSPEFAVQYSALSDKLNIDAFMPPQDFAPMSVQVDATPGQLQRLLDRIRGEWEAFGESEPHWSVLTHDSFKKEFLAENLDRFYQSGADVVNIMTAFAKRNDIELADFKHCFELGCGVGRITTHLSGAFAQVTARIFRAFILMSAARNCGEASGTMCRWFRLRK